MFRVISITITRFSRNVERKENERMFLLYFDLYHIDRPVRPSGIRKQDGFYDNLKRR